jgi:hexosaminidase
MLDASRHFQPVAIVKHVLDYMLSMKLNIFHWHLSDDEGWRVQSSKHPELNIYGSFMNDSNKLETNGFYTLEEIRDIIIYATDRNIEIIPECDIPGHSLAVLSAFPQLKCPYKPGSNAFCAGNPKTYEVIKDIFGELIDIFKPRYIHIGGDERQKDLWNKCDLCLAKMKEVGVTNENDLQNKMLIEISDFIHSKGVKTISWAENLEGGIAESQIIQSWRLKDEAFTAIKKGHYVINSDNMECYLDYPENPEDAKSKPSWMVILPIEKVYNFNPVPQGLTKEEEKMVLGSECPLWTESITIDKIYPQIKDRLEAHAEKCWTQKEQKNYPDFTNRLNVLREYFKFQYYGEVAEIRTIQKSKN